MDLAVAGVVIRVSVSDDLATVFRRGQSSVGHFIVTTVICASLFLGRAFLAATAITPSLHTFGAVTVEFVATVRRCVFRTDGVVSPAVAMATHVVVATGDAESDAIAGVANMVAMMAVAIKQSHFLFISHLLFGCGLFFFTSFLLDLTPL